MKFYTYPKCSTCKKAEKWLEENGIAVEVIDIKEQPPGRAELEEMLGHLGELRKLFNTSGMVYRELGLKDKLAGMSKEEAFGLLESNGMLVKRPFLLGKGVGVVGFREKQWETSVLTPLTN